MNFNDLIFDRTLNDVNEVKMKIDNPKGAYNYTDLNRVETACMELKNILTSLDYYIPEMTFKTDWSVSDGALMNELDNNFERILSNIKTLRASYYTLPNTPATPDTISNGKLDYIKANDIEKILFDMNSIILSMKANFRYSGTFNAGTSRKELD